MYCLQVDNLHKKYHSVHAVKGISFNVPKGICFGLLGPNGAGKSTTIEILEAIKEPTEGKIFFNGQLRDQYYKERIGIQFQHTALQDFMKVGEALKTFSTFYDNPYPIDAIVKICQLEDIIHRDHRYLSGGQKKRLLLALSILHNPDLIFLDEPTTGLDPSSRMAFWKLIEFIKKQGRTIILTTHYMDEAYFLCDEMVLIDQGVILDQGKPKHLLQKYFKGTRVTFPAMYKKHLGDFREHWVDKGTHVELKVDNTKEFIQTLIHQNIPLNEIQITPYTLDDLFVHLTGRTLISNYDEYI